MHSTPEVTGPPALGRRARMAGQSQHCFVDATRSGSMRTAPPFLASTMSRISPFAIPRSRSFSYPRLRARNDRQAARGASVMPRTPATFPRWKCASDRHPAVRQSPPASIHLPRPQRPSGNGAHPQPTSDSARSRMQSLRLPDLRGRRSGASRFPKIIVSGSCQEGEKNFLQASIDHMTRTPDACGKEAACPSFSTHKPSTT